MIGYSKKNREDLSERVLLILEENEPGLKFNPGLALTGVRTTGSRANDRRFKVLHEIILSLPTRSFALRHCVQLQC